jgi:hypothetical protein
MLKEISSDINTPAVVALNRYVEMALVFFNTLVGLMLLTAPWYIVENDATFTEVSMGCVVPEGTVLAPFVSKPCGKAFTAIAAGGKGWSDMHIYVWVYFGLALLGSALIGYEVVKHGVREWNDANTIGFVVQLALVVIQSLILAKSGSLVKPSSVDSSTAEILIITAVVLSALRLSMLGFFMYITKKYNPRGYFGTGAYA